MLTEEKIRQTENVEVPPPSAELFNKLTRIESLPETESSKQLKDILKQKSQDMLKAWQDRGFISTQEANSVSTAWENTIILDSQGMEMFGQYQSSIFEKAKIELDARNSEPEMATLAEKAKAIIESTKLTCKQAGALTFRPSSMQAEESNIDTPLPSFILINTDKTTTENPGKINATAFEETAHLISKLSQYPEANTKWLEETMARVVAFETPSAHGDQNEKDSKTAADILRYHDYKLLFHIVNKQIGDNGETLLRMFFGREPLNSPLVSKAEKAIKSVDMIAQIVDAGIPLDNLLEQKDK